VFAPAAGSPPVSTNSDVDDLQGRKRELKRQLKQYDMNFARRHGRMPVKSEKEPIRHLYESYNALKSKIGNVEQEGRTKASPSPTLSVSSIISQRSDSPDSVESEDSPVRPLPTRRRRVPRDSTSPPLTSGAMTGVPSQDLQALKQEKSQLHQMLRSYERDFFEEHRRQVSSFSDIRPVASQYRRYKEIKRAIAALQQVER
jgi:flagellar biosynthesis/type III secretory pathway chaperone